MMSSIVRTCAALLGAGGLWIAYSQFGTQPAKLDLVKIKDDLYVIHNDYVPGNTTALITNSGVLLVDDKFEIDHNNILAELKKVTSQPVKYVINTHHHGDHSGGNAKLQALGAQVVTSQQARENMADGKLPGVPAMTFERHATIWIGGKNVELYYFGRAHTNGDAVALFPGDRTLAAGDMFTVGDATPELIDYAGGGSAKEWPKTLDAALQLDFDTAVPGHGVVSTKAQMRRFREDTARLNSRIHEMMTQKKSRDEVAGMLKKEFHWEQLHLDTGLDGAMAELR